jgi:hypothetical protein
MKRKEDIEVIHGSGNVFRDLKRPEPDVKQFKGILAAEIIKMLGRDRLTVRAAQTRTGIAAAEVRTENPRVGGSIPPLATTSY